MRLIDADELYKTVTEKYHDIRAGGYPYNIVAFHMAQLVKEAPTIETEPVRHGEWLRTPAFRSIDEHKHICSCCGFQMYMTKRVKEMHKYCPHCGSKMDSMPSENI